MATLTLRRVIRIAIVSAVLVLSVELGLRLTTGLGNPPLFQKDPEIGYLMAANQQVYRLGKRISTNQFHQRSEDLSALPASGVKRIFFLGDSITFGVSSVDQSEIFSELVATQLRTKGRAIEVMNASAVSWGIGNERAYVERFGTFGSEIAVLQIGSSDLLQPTSVSDGVGINPSQPDRKPFTAIGELLGRYLLPSLMEFLQPTVEEREPVTSADREKQFQENMQDFSVLVSKIRKQCTLPIILLMPGLPEVMPQDEQWLTKYAPYRSRFRKIVEMLDLPLLDLSVEWRGDSRAPTYYTDGTHLTLEGNRVVSARVSAAVDQRAERGTESKTCIRD